MLSQTPANDLQLGFPSLQDERFDAIAQLHAATAIYTAGHVVSDLFQHLGWPGENRFLVDPSCGDGIFLGHALGLLLAIAGITDQEIEAQLQGWEIHPGACAESRARVADMLIAAGRNAAAARALAERLVINADFLVDGPRVPTFDFLAGNPPYCRISNVPALLREDYAACVPGYASSDLLHSFLDRCAQTVKPGGVVAMVTADRWLFNEGASRLRASIGESLAISHLERLDQKTTFYRPKNRKTGTPPRIHPVAVVLSEPAPGLRAITKDAIYPGVNAEDDHQGYTTLGEVAQVKLAPWLGSPGIFVVSEEEAKAFPPDELVPAVDTDDVVKGVLQTPKRFAIVTRASQRPSEATLSHLDARLHAMAPRGRRMPRWIPPETFEQWDLSQPSLMIPRIALGPTAIRLPAGILPVNHNLNIVVGSAEVLDRIEAALKTPMVIAWVKSHAARLENDYLSITAKLLRKMPLPGDWSDVTGMLRQGGVPDLLEAA
jgi:hypothetical protein